MRRAPRLDRRVELLTITTDVADTGAVTETETSSRLWAALTAAPSDPAVVIGGEVQAIPTRHWLMRYRAAVTLPARLVDDGVTYRLNDVSEAHELGRRRFLRLTGARI